MRLFDAYILVDWSANSSPKEGKDSIWIAAADVADPDLRLITRNPSTRTEAIRLIQELLQHHVQEDRRVLAGFDFPYGYPAGFAAALSDGARPPAPWRATWSRLAAEITDDASNQNNRFAVASRLNIACGMTEGPFWGCPQRAATEQLRARAPRWESGGLRQYRHVEQRLRSRTSRVQEVWKLWTAGSVGGQTLVGVPRLAALRYAPPLQGFSAVWPFETGFTPVIERRPLVVHAEIWPGIVRIDPADMRVRDKVQVETLARHFAALDRMGALEALFARPAGLVDAAIDECLAEEGWILGA